MGQWVVSSVRPFNGRSSTVEVKGFHLIPLPLSLLRIVQIILPAKLNLHFDEETS